MQPIVVSIPAEVSCGFDTYFRVRPEDLEHYFHNKVVRHMTDGMTHKIKDNVLTKLPQEALDELGCANPDIFVVSKKDDRIVITPSRTARRNRDYRKTRVVTGVRARDIEMQGNWRDHIFPLKFEVVDHFFGMIDSDSGAFSTGIRWEEMFRLNSVDEVVFIPEVNEERYARAAMLLLFFTPRVEYVGDKDYEIEAASENAKME